MLGAVGRLLVAAATVVRELLRTIDGPIMLLQLPTRQVARLGRLLIVRSLGSSHSGSSNSPRCLSPCPPTVSALAGKAYTPSRKQRMPLLSDSILPPLGSTGSERRPELGATVRNPGKDNDREQGTHLIARERLTGH